MKALALAISLVFVSNVVLAHGGGCRKSSPVGQCCHKETKTGEVHCHSK